MAEDSERVPSVLCWIDVAIVAEVIIRVTCTATRLSTTTPSMRPRRLMEFAGEPEMVLDRFHFACKSQADASSGRSETFELHPHLDQHATNMTVEPTSSRNGC